MQDKPCPFCDFKALENETWFVAWEPFPVGVGHVKLMPKRHDATMRNLTIHEKSEYFELLERVFNYLDGAFGNEHKPEGYNIGVNIGEAAGQTIAHLHIHIIPRYKGDVENPRGGIRNIKKALVAW